MAETTIILQPAYARRKLICSKTIITEQLNLLKEAKWAIDTKHWDNISRYEFLRDETDVFKEPKLEDPVFLKTSNMKPEPTIWR